MQCTVTKCLVKDCDRHAVARGLCFPCYQVARTSVLLGKTTWEELQKLGLSTRVKTRRIKNAFMSAYDEKKSERESEVQDTGM